jgi:hypothetical protein
MITGKILIILFIIGAIIILIKFLEKNQKNKIYPYKSKKYIMSKAELSFYHNLKHHISEEYTVFTKVRIEDIIYVPSNTQNFMKYRGHIKSRHIDFLICDKKTGEIKQAIELNDSSHKRKDRIKRDNFIKDAFQAAGIKLININCKKNYTREDIKSILFN